MPTTLELLRAEHQEQAIDEAHPAIHSVEDARSLISNECPAPNMNIPFEMCVLRIEERDRFWRLDLVGRDDEREFEKILEMFNLLDVPRRHKCVFQLTIWKNRDEDLNRLSYRPGFSYRFERVHSLKLMYGNPMGSMQIRQRIETEPLIRGQPANNENDHLHVTPCADNNREDQLQTASSRSAARDGTEATPPHSSPIAGGHIGHPSGEGGDVTTQTPSRKSVLRRNPSVDEESGPVVKQRKPNPKSGKALAFESPPTHKQL